MTTIKGLGYLIEAMILVESGGNPWAIGDRRLSEPAYGVLQIRQTVCDDFNLFHGIKHRASELLGQPDLSVKICKWYLGHYATKERLGRPPTDKDRARIWNGGPDGWKKKSTKSYWRKVAKQLNKKERRQSCAKRSK